MVGGVFGGVASLKNDLQDLRRRYAWKRLEVSKRLVEDLKGSSDPHDGRINEYEFTVGSLLLLHKINKGDIEVIMEKFRQLAGDGNEYIEYSDPNDESGDDDNVFDLEGENINHYGEAEKRESMALQF